MAEKKGAGAKARPKPKPKKSGSRRETRRGPLRRLVRLVVVVLIVLVLLPVVLVPVYSVVRPPFSTLQLWTFVTTGKAERRWVPLDEIARVLPESVIMSEDGKFCEHRGVDWDAVRLVIESDTARGASTIPMQVAKNLFLWQSRSYVRKALEVPLAYYIDLLWTKRRIIEVYLNIVEWGPGIFGAEAAAQHWFDIPASRISQRQAALLAAVLPNPLARNPAKPGRSTSRAAGLIEGRARQAGAYVQCLREE
jgi:monofunctional biosynthetic peptidoglycan transglycosylase